MRIEMRVKDVELIVEENGESGDTIYAKIDHCKEVFANLYSMTQPIKVDYGCLNVTED